VKVINIHKFLSNLLKNPNVNSKITSQIVLIPNLSLELALLKMARAIKANTTQLDKCGINPQTLPPKRLHLIGDGR